MKILVIEDNAAIAIEHEMLIQDLGHDCVGIAANSAKALAIARAEAPNVALVDLSLADGWTGPALVEKLHGMKIASIVVSGQVEDYEAPEHVVSVLAKPLRTDFLASVLRKLSVR
jgi:response regulator of citrate/malate metabolism